MKPLRDRAYEGRVNPKGVPCLYLATDPETAMMRLALGPVLFSLFSQLVLLKQVMVVDARCPPPLILMSRPRAVGENSWYVLTRRLPCRYFNPKTLRITRRAQYIAEAFSSGRIRRNHVPAAQVVIGKNIALFDVHCG